jgi:hypothetical protein
MKVLVSLLNDNVWLVHRAVKHFAPEKHIILHLPTPHSFAKRFAPETVFEAVENSADSVQQACQTILNAHADDELYFHLSAGTTLTQLFMLDFTKQHRRNAYRFEGDALFTFTEGGVSTTKISEAFSIEEYIKAHGFRVFKNSEDMASAQKLMTALNNYLTASHIQRLNSAANGEFLVRMPGRLEIQVDAPEGESRQVIIKTAGFQKMIDAESLIELYIFQQLSAKYKGSIQLALRIVREGGAPRDIDVAFIKDGLLHIIVSRGNPNIRGGIFEQLFAIHQRFEGLTAKLYFLMKDSSASNPNNLKRAKLFGIELLSAEQIGSL